MVGFLVPLAAVIPAIPLVGYLVRVQSASARGEDAPAMDRPADLLRVGAAGVAIAVAYLLVPLVALVVTVYGAITTVEGDLSFFDQVILYGGSTAVLTAFIAASFTIPAAWTAYEEERSLRAAVSPSRLWPILSHAAYFSRWMAGAVALSMAVSFGTVALQVVRVGPIIASLIVAYGLLVAATVWGLGVRYARER
jgi:hypothetical protein